MIEIDGSFGEGGGQIVRTALALAAVFGKKVRIYNIRLGRPVPGIKAQHLASVRAVAAVSSAKVQGLSVGSTELTFDPGTVTAGTFRFDVGTAGSISLVLQTIMPVLPFLPGDSKIEITGGTDVRWSPPIDYLRLVTLPVLEKMGYSASLEILRRGHFPKGGGHIIFQSHPSRSLNSIQGEASRPITQITCVSHATKLPRHVARRQAESATRVLLEKNLPNPEVQLEVSENHQSIGPGSGIVLSAIDKKHAILGADSLGERGTPAEKVGAVAAERLVEEAESNAFLDQHMADIIVPYLALAKGASEVTVSKVTQHLLTNVKIAEILTGIAFESPGQSGQPGVLRVSGIGLASREVSVSPRE